MELYLIRHGQTDWNNQFLIQGRTNNELNEAGRQQAREITHFFKEVKPTKLISSPLVRAVETLNIIKENHNWDISIVENEKFIERDFGEFEGKDVKMYNEETDYTKYELFEQNQQIEKRVSQGIEEIVADAKKDDVVIIACHSHTMKSFLTHYYPEKYNYKYKLKNCGIIKVIIDNKEQLDIKASIIH